jgi:hypothetical protein
MVSKLRFIFIFIVLGLFCFLFGLSVSRHIYLGGPLVNKYLTQITILSEILPNINSLIRNPIGVSGLFVPLKETYMEDNFNVSGLFSYLSKDGWVIVDKNHTKESIIYINWKEIKGLYYQHCENKNCINSKFAAQPINPLKISDDIIFHFGGVLFKYNIKNKKFIAFKGSYHHSIEPFQDSLIYVCSYGNDTLGIKNDAISLLNINTGKIVYKKSIPNILLNSELKYIYRSKKPLYLKNDLIHVNDIQPVNKNTLFAKKGDLFLSLLGISTIVLYRPSNDSILWYNTGPWIKQHDIDIINDEVIGVYNNNVSFGIFLANTYSNIITYNFKNKKFDKISDSFFKKYKIQSLYSSRFEILDNGNLFVEDSPSGMYYLISKEGNLISSKNFPYDKKNTIVGSWARPYVTKKY